MIGLIQTTQPLMEVEPHFSFNEEKLALYLDICTVFIYTNPVASHQHTEFFYFLERNHLDKDQHPLSFGAPISLLCWKEAVQLLFL